MRLKHLHEHCGHCHDDDPNHFVWNEGSKFEITDGEEKKEVSLKELNEWLKGRAGTRRQFETDEDYVGLRWKSGNAEIKALL